jgi:transcriptional regulator with XRE-family HTH domain
MLRRLGVEELIRYTRISDYERGEREPPLIVLLQYARVAGVPTEVLIDDELDLPANLPDKGYQEEIRRKFASRQSRAGRR